MSGIASLPEAPLLRRLASRGRARWPGGAAPAGQGGALTRIGVPLVVVALAACSPWYGIARLGPNLLVTICLYGIAASGLNLLFGYAGMLSLGNGIFIGVGGYATGIVAQRYGLPMWAAILVGVGASVVAGAVLGAILVRLSGHYFGVATLALALAFVGLVTALGFTGGGTGLTTATRLPLGFTTVSDATQWYVLTLVVTAAMLALLAWIVAGRRGRILRLVRSDELAASVLGVRVYLVKLVVFTIAAAFAGVAGALLFPSQGLVDPESVGILVSVQMAMLVVIGGPGYRVGGLIGAFVVLWLQAMLNSFGNYELLVYGAILLAVVFYLRPGLEGAVVAGWRALLRRLGPTGGTLAPVRPPVQAASLAAGRQGGPAPAGGTGLAAGLEVRSISRRFGGLTAVDGVSLQAPRGAVTALIGANGAGKSTLLNLISGVEPADAGAVLLDGADITATTPAERTRRGLARTFQVPRLVDELSVAENMVLGREAAAGSLVRRRPEEERAALEEARATLAQLGLEALAERPTSSLGTGERKYVEVARAVFTEAAAVLLDEPAVGLSLEEVAQLQAWLEAIRDAGAAVLVVDHNLDFIRELADHVYAMDSGRIRWEGPPGEVRGFEADLAAFDDAEAAWWTSAAAAAEQP